MATPRTWIQKIKFKSSIEEVRAAFEQEKRAGDPKKRVEVGDGGWNYDSIDGGLLYKKQNAFWWELYDQKIEKGQTIEEASEFNQKLQKTLAWAAFLGNIEFVQEWVRRGLPVELPQTGKSSTITPLMAAVWRNEWELAKILAGAGADWYAERTNTQMPSHAFRHAIYMDKVSAMSLVFSTGHTKMMAIANEYKKEDMSIWSHQVPYKFGWQDYQEKDGKTVIRLDELVGRLMEVSSTYMQTKRGFSLPKEWWSSLRKGGWLSQWEKTPYANGRSVESFLGVKSDPSMSAGLIVGKKEVDEDSLMMCLELITMARRGSLKVNETTLKSTLTSARNKELWKVGGIGEYALKNGIPITTRKDVLASSGDNPEHPFVTLAFGLFQSGLWKVGMENPVLAQIVWRTLMDRMMSNTAAYSHRTVPYEFGSEKGFKKTAQFLDALMAHAFDDPEETNRRFHRLQEIFPFKNAKPRGLMWPGQNAAKPILVRESIQTFFENWFSKIATFPRGHEIAQELLTHKNTVLWCIDRKVVAHERILEVIQKYEESGAQETNANQYQRARIQEMKIKIEHSQLTQSFGVSSVKRKRVL